MKTKTQSKSKKPKTAKAVRPKVQEYPAHYLAITLAVVLIAQGIIMGSATSSDWNKALSVLDMSSTISQSATNFVATVQPMIDEVASINQFYQMSATQMISLLDFSDRVGDLSLVYDGVTAFYQQASDQMAYLLDVTNTGFWPGSMGTVAGASTTR